MSPIFQNHPPITNLALAWGILYFSIATDNTYQERISVSNYSINLL
jgi:hypothetical protein